MSKSLLQRHYPVMLDNVLQEIGSLRLKRTLRVADCNFGLGGHSNSILTKFPNAKMYLAYANICSDAWEIDERVLQHYKNTLELQTGDQTRLTLHHENFGDIGKAKGDRYDVVLADLGYNSLQLEEWEGFSWMRDSELDMRYSPSFTPAKQYVSIMNIVCVGQFNECTGVDEYSDRLRGPQQA